MIATIPRMVKVMDHAEESSAKTATAAPTISSAPAASRSQAMVFPSNRVARASGITGTGPSWAMFPVSIEVRQLPQVIQAGALALTLHR